MLFQSHKLPKSASLLIFHIFLFYLCSKFVTNIWPSIIFCTFQFYFTYEKFHPLHIKKDKCGEGTFELVRAKLIYFARLLNRSKTCSSQVTILSSSIYLLVIFFHLYSPHKLAAAVRFYPACSPLLSCWGRGKGTRNRCWERWPLQGCRGQNLPCLLLSARYSSCRHPVNGLSSARTVWER